MNSTQGVYAKVFEQVIEQMEQGVAPWVRPWTGEPSTPYNAATGRHYTGGNVLALWAQGMVRGFSSSGWVTFKQALEAGCVVRKGEKGATVFFMSKAIKKQAHGADGQREKDDEPSSYFFARSFTVFNVEQLDGLDEGAVEALKARHGTLPTLTSFDRIEACEELVTKSEAVIQHGGHRACYNPTRDVIQMPEAETFVGREAYYGTLFHELTHWTGHESRLKRITPAKFGTPAYAFEELVAELGAAFVSSRFGIETVSQSAAYLQNWAKACREHPDLLARAASLAGKAADYLAGAQAPAAVEA
jgi:antirestriction protein ArdC